MICSVKAIFDYTDKVAKRNNREEICAEVVRLLVEERKRRGLSGNSLAEKSGLSQSLISSLESNPWNPTLDTLLRICEVLDLDLGAVITAARKSVLMDQANKSSK